MNRRSEARYCCALILWNLIFSQIAPAHASDSTVAAAPSRHAQTYLEASYARLLTQLPPTSRSSPCDTLSRHPSSFDLLSHCFLKQLSPYCRRCWARPPAFRLRQGHAAESRGSRVPAPLAQALSPYLRQRALCRSCGPGQGLHTPSRRRQRGRITMPAPAARVFFKFFAC